MEFSQPPLGLPVTSQFQTLTWGRNAQMLNTGDLHDTASSST